MLTRPPLVSVIIPTYNYAAFIEQAIKSVLDQTFQNFEILVVDDGSTDNTREVIKKFPARYIYQTNRGAAAARNYGIREARGELIAFLDADDLWLPDKLEKQLQMFERDPGIGLVYSLFYFFESESGAIIGYKPIRECARGFVLTQMFGSCIIGSPTPLIRRDVFEKVGLYQEGLTGVEDYHLWLRIAAQYRIDYVPEYLAMYRVHESRCSSKKLGEWMRALETILIDCQHSYPELIPQKVLNRRLATLHRKVSCRARLSTSAYNAAQVHYQRGKILLARGRQGEALSSFLKTICYDPTKLKAWGGLFLCLCPKVLVKSFFAGERRIFLGQPTPATTAKYLQY